MNMMLTRTCSSPGAAGARRRPWTPAAARGGWSLFSCCISIYLSLSLSLSLYIYIYVNTYTLSVSAASHGCLYPLLHY